jgi:nucleotide-binding universal stress UspA family protein
MEKQPSPMKTPIVVGTDLTRSSAKVVRYAARVARMDNRPLYLIHARVIVPDASTALWDMEEEALLKQRHRAHNIIHGKDGDNTPVSDVHRLLVLGSAGEELLRVARSLGAAYIIVGTHGRTGLNRLLIGSTAEFVMRRSDCPVIVIGPHAAALRDKGIPWKQILFISDLASGMTDAAKMVGKLAVDHQAKLAIVTVQKDIQQVQEDAYEVLRPVLPREDWLTKKPQCLICEGDPSIEIPRMASDFESDLIVMSVQKGGELATHLREGIAVKIIRAARCPVMLLRNTSDLKALSGDLRARAKGSTSH